MSEHDRIRFGSTLIEYTVLRGRWRHKTIEITVDPSEGILVAAPISTPCEQIRRVVTRRAGWIVRRASTGVLQPNRKQFVSGESLPYLGRQARLFVEHADVRRVGVKFSHWSFQVVAPAGTTGEHRRRLIERGLSRWYRDRAEHRLSERVDRWSRLVGCSPATVLIRDQRRRWASCGLDGALRFNWRIVMAPPALIDYVVVHELVHLSTKHHSAAFWAEMLRLMPDYKLRRAQLRDLGPSLAV